jgi:hypothetical protein
MYKKAELVKIKKPFAVIIFRIAIFTQLSFA